MADYYFDPIPSLQSTNVTGTTNVPVTINSDVDEVLSVKCH